jgi:ABC-type lipoprotein release transport system permease subunit
MFSLPRFLLRSLLHYWRINLCVALAAGVGVAVLAGSLLVGESVRRSLRALVLERLGRTDHALVTDLFLRQELVSAFQGAAPAILLSGSVTQAEGGARASRVQVFGVDDGFWRLGETSRPGGFGEEGAGVVLNDRLAREIRAREGDEVLLRVEKPSAVARETFLGERDDTVVVLRLAVGSIVPSEGIGGFSLHPTQQKPMNLFVPLALLQKRLEREGRVNAILAPESAGDLSGILAQHARLEDAGLRLRRGEDHLALESDRIFLDPYAEELVGELTHGRESRESRDESLPPPPTRALAYLVNEVRMGERSLPYSTAAAVDDPSVRSGEALLNAWAAEDLGAKTGDDVALTYFVHEPDGRLVETSASLRVAGILPMEDPRVSQFLIPDFPGVTDADSMGDWDPPFPLDLNRVRPADEEYWQTYRTAPKILVSLETGQELWANRYGRVTSFVWRLAEQDQEKVIRQIRNRFDPARSGLSFRPVKEESLQASRGSSDFGGLFVGFSLFLLLSAAMMIQILFRLGVEGRARELGILSAAGFAPGKTRRLLLAEGAVVAAAGGIAGIGLAVFYARVLVYGLNTWWVGAVAEPFLRFRLSPAALLAGFGGGWLVAMASIFLAVRRMLRVPARVLLSGQSREEPPPGVRRGRGKLWAGVVLSLLALVLVLAAPALSAQTQAALFFATGAALLAAALCFLATWLGGGGLNTRESSHKKAAALTLTRLGASAARRNPGRSLLVVGLVATSTFLIVAVGANRQTPASQPGKESGSGGFALVAESALPIYRPVKDLLREAGVEADLLEDATLYALRLRAGDDASCLNLYRAGQPRLLGAPDDFIERGGFLFAASEAGKEPESRNPWMLLRRQLPDGAIPAMGDYNTVVWLLHSGLGKEIEMAGHRLRFAGLLKKSIFQSELLIGERNFKRAAPTESGRRYFAVEAPQGKAPRLAAAMESALEDFGFDATETVEKLRALMEVENTYLATFQSLGGLGLMLGTLGLALALARNLIERRRELALLRVLGYRLGALLWLAVSENLLLLVAGMGAGAVCALVAVAPALFSRSVAPPWPSLIVTLFGILAFGTAAAAVSAAAVLRQPSLSALKTEA